MKVSEFGPGEQDTVPPPRRRRGRAFAVIVMLGLAGLAVYGWREGWFGARQERPAAQQRPPMGRRVFEPTGVTLATVGRADMTVALQALGTVTSISTVTVRAQISGQLQSVNFREGQSVAKGDLLAQLDPRPFQAALSQAQAQLARDQALLQGAQIDLQRYQGLAAQNAVARQTLDTQRALVAQYTATVAADRAAVQTAEINLGYTRITAPVDGRIGLRQVDPGNYVTPGDASGLVVITQLQPISVVFSVPEDRLGQVAQRLRDGARLAVHAFDRAGQNRIAEGVLGTFDSQIDQTTGTIRLRAAFPNTDLRLFPNQFVNITLNVDVHAGVPVAPSAAIQRGVQGPFVYLFDTAARTVSVRQVGLGIGDGDKVEIVSGLQPGDKIVVDGTDRLREGMTVEVRGEDGQAAPAAGRPPPSGEGQRRRGGGRRGPPAEAPPGATQPGGTPPAAAPSGAPQPGTAPP